MQVASENASWTHIAKATEPSNSRGWVIRKQRTRRKCLNYPVISGQYLDCIIWFRHFGPHPLCLDHKYIKRQKLSIFVDKYTFDMLK